MRGNVVLVAGALFSLRDAPRNKASLPYSSVIVKDFTLIKTNGYFSEKGYPAASQKEKWLQMRRTGAGASHFGCL